MSNEFKNRTFIVTGGGSGMGRSVSLALGKAGANVVIGNRDAARGERVANDVIKAGGQAVFKPTNVALPDDCRALVALAEERFGGLDGAFNNAGSQREFVAMHETPDEHFSDIIDVNLKGTCYMMKYEIAALLRTGSGSIVNNSSIFGLKAMPRLAYYVASKHGIVGASRAAALDYAERGIRVNAICPGPIKTPSYDRVTGGDDHMYDEGVPMRRIGQPGEVSDVVLWLLSDASTYVTGTCIPVDGGMSAS